METDPEFYIRGKSVPVGPKFRRHYNVSIWMEFYINFVTSETVSNC